MSKRDEIRELLSQGQKPRQIAKKLKTSVREVKECKTGTANVRLRNDTFIMNAY